MTPKIRFGPPKRWHFIMDAMHKMPVPDESKQEDENEGSDECDEEFFPVHNFSVEVLLTPKTPWNVLAKSWPVCRYKLQLRT